MSFSTEEIREKIVRVISEKLKISADEIQDDATLEDLGADSLDVVEIVMNIEEAFNIEIGDDAAEKFKTVGDVVNYISEMQK
ncbi:acyl carrier protein [bacterium]|nr:acyl carrier protein [bacterium]